MADISKIKLESTTYDIKDSTARNTGIYSSNEVAIGKWIDDKTIYRKVFRGTTLPSSNTITYSISSLSIDTVVNLYGGAYQTGGKYRPIPLVTNSTNGGIRIDIDGGNIRITTYENWIGWETQAVIEYTKTS